MGWCGLDCAAADAEEEDILCGKYIDRGLDAWTGWWEYCCWGGFIADISRSAVALGAELLCGIGAGWVRSDAALVIVLLLAAEAAPPFVGTREYDARIALLAATCPCGYSNRACFTFFQKEWADFPTTFTDDEERPVAPPDALRTRGWVIWEEADLDTVKIRRPFTALHENS